MCSLARCRRRQLPPVVSLPFVVSYGQIDVAVGAAVILLGLFAFAVAGMNLTSMVVPYCLASLFVLTLQVRSFLNLTLALALNHHDLQNALYAMCAICYVRYMLCALAVHV